MKVNENTTLGELTKYYNHCRKHIEKTMTIEHITLCDGCQYYIPSEGCTVSCPVPYNWLIPDTVDYDAKYLVKAERYKAGEIPLRFKYLDREDGKQ